MIRFGIKTRFKVRSTFNGRKVREAVARKQTKAISRSAAYVMTVARRSIRKRKRSSTPGSPPSGHTQDLKRHILFDAGPRDAIIGAELLASRNHFDGSGDPISGTIPEALEKAGKLRLLEIWIPKPVKFQKFARHKSGRNHSPAEVARIRAWYAQRHAAAVAAQTEYYWAPLTRFRAKRFPHAPRRERIVSVAARPFMQPALIASQNAVAGFWAEAL